MSNKDVLFVGYDIFGRPQVLKENEEGELFVPEKKKKFSPYEYVKCIVNKKDVTDEMVEQIKTSSYNRYIIDCWFASNPRYLFLIAEMQQNKDLDNIQHFTILYRSIKRGDYTANFFKKSKSVDDNEIDAIKFYFKCKTSLAYKYKNVISSAGVTELMEHMQNSKSDKKIKKPKKNVNF